MAMKCCTKLETAKERCPIVFQGHPSNFKVTRDKTSPILTQIGRFRTIGRSQLSNPSDLPCWYCQAILDKWWLRHLSWNCSQMIFVESNWRWVKHGSDDGGNGVVKSATLHYLSQFWSSYMSPYVVTRPQWIKPSVYFWYVCNGHIIGMCVCHRLAHTQTVRPNQIDGIVLIYVHIHIHLTAVLLITGEATDNHTDCKNINIPRRLIDKEGRVKNMPGSVATVALIEMMQ